LLYVAVTRAKRELHLLGNAEATSREGEIALREPRKGSMLRLLWQAVAPSFEAVAPAAAAPHSGSPMPPQKIRRLPADWRLPDVPLSLRASLEPLIDIAAPVPFDWVTHTSRHVGTLVHRELDRMGRGEGMQLAGKLQAARPRLIAELAELGVPVDRCQAACERVIAAIEQILADPRGRWLLGLDAGLKDMRSEFALSGVLQGRVVTGVIDRTFIDERGRRWIVDFKTSTHEGGGLEEFLAAEAERYRPQLLRYAQLMALLKPQEEIHAALYFPLLRTWKEVDIGRGATGLGLRQETKQEKAGGQLRLL
jgi:ATP-dependent exoDNAse (exonuclease V) beta subunit